MRELNENEIDGVAGANFFNWVYDTAKAAGEAAFNAVDGAVNNYIESANQMDKSTDYENHPDYIGIGGPF